MRLVGLIFSFALVALSALGNPPDQAISETKERSHWEQAIDLFQVGQYNDAIGEFQKSYQQQATTFHLYYIGLSYQRAGNYAEALRYYRLYHKVADIGSIGIAKKKIIEVEQLLLDSDADGVPDSQDACRRAPMGPHPDTKPGNRGCPAPDQDGDGETDYTDQCVAVAQGPYPDPTKPGCPGLVLEKNGKIKTSAPVAFKEGGVSLLPASLPVLITVKDVLLAAPQIKRVVIEGHTNNRGKAKHLTRLSGKRAANVRRWLVEHGIAPSRLEHNGFGKTKPITTNKTATGRAANERIEFRIIE